MKKNLKHSMYALSVLLVATFATACGGGGTTDPDNPGNSGTVPEGSIEMTGATAFLYGDVLYYGYNHDAHDVELAELVLTSGTIVWQSGDQGMSYQGDGSVVKLGLLAKTLSSGEVKLQTGVYNVATFDAANPKAGITIPSPTPNETNLTVLHPSFVGSGYVVDTLSIFQLTAGKVTISEKDGVYTVLAELKSNTQSHTFYYNGAIKQDKRFLWTVDALYEPEPAKSNETINIEFDEVSISLHPSPLYTHQDVNASMLVYQGKNVTIQCNLAMKAPYGTGARIYDKTYPFMYGEGEQFRCVSGLYQKDNVDNNGIVRPVGSALLYNKQYYYLVNGSVEISDDEYVSFEAISGRGTKIIGTSKDTYMLAD